METLLVTVVWAIIQLAGLFLLADFVAGIFHWAEDTLGADDTPFWGPAFAAPNSIHHSDPAAMNKIHWFRNNLPLVSFAVLVVLACWIFGALTWQIVAFAIFGGFTQQAHRFSHAPTVRLPWFIGVLQRCRLLQDSRHHWVHHTPPHLTRYCVMTPWVNPVLDFTRFWRAMERIFVPIFGAPRRPDLESKKWYRDTAIWNRQAAV